MKLISWNVNGIRACVSHGFSDVLTRLNPDVLGLQEIKIDDLARAKHDFDFAKYEEYWNPAERKGYSGTAILSKSPITVINGFGYPEFDSEGRVQIADLGGFWFINAYFPNSQHELSRIDYKCRFNETLLKYLKKLESTKPIIIAGDFNVAREEIDLARPKENVGNPGFSDQERYWADKYLEAGLADTYRELHGNKIRYSWWSYRANARAKNIGWRIDYFLVSRSLLPRITSADIFDTVAGSDHAPIGMEIDM